MAFEDASVVEVERQLSVMEIVNNISSSGLITTDWSETLCTAPGVIVIMGESMVLASVPNAAQVRIKAEHLSGVASKRVKQALQGFTLPSTLYECTQIGQSAFLKAHIGMSKIRLHSESVVPTINQIIHLYDGCSPGGKKPLLDMFLRKLRRSAKICADESLQIKAEFDWWAEFSTGLARAVVGTRGDVNDEKGENDQKLELQNNELVQAQTEEERAKEELDRRKVTLQDSVKWRDEVVEQAQTAVTWGAQCGGLEGIAITAVAAAGATYHAQLNVKEAEQQVERRRKAMEEAEVARERLMGQMRLLQAKDAKLADIVRILQHSLDKLNTLQKHINNLLIFFTEISAYVELLVNDTIADDGFLDQMAEVQGLDPANRAACIDSIMFSTALSIKTRFLVMQKIAQTYSQVSRAEIMPGFGIIDSVSLTELNLSNPQVSNRSRMLSKYNLEATENIRSVVLERQTELQNGMQLIAEEGARGLSRRIAQN